MQYLVILYRVMQYHILETGESISEEELFSELRFGTWKGIETEHGLWQITDGIGQELTLEVIEE